MIRVNIAEATAGFSRLLRAAQAGEPVIVCERNVPIAEIRALPRPLTTRRPLGPARPGFALPASFFDPLPEDMLRAFEGHDADSSRSVRPAIDRAERRE